MPLITAFTDRYPWADPAPVGYVDHGWATIVADLLHRIDGLLATDPGATVDILDVSGRCGVLRFDFAVDQAGTVDPALVAAIHSAVAEAEARSRTTCPHGGHPKPAPSAARPAITPRGALPHAWAVGR